MSQLGNDYNFYVAAKLGTVNEENARAITSSVCKVKSLSVTASRAEITSATRCGVSKRSGALSVGIDVTFEFDTADAYYELLRNAFFVTNEKVFVAEILGEITNGQGIAGNVSVGKFDQKHDTDAYAEVSVNFLFEVADLLILEAIS